MYKSIAANKRNTVFIMAIFVAIIGAIGWVISMYYGNTNITYIVIIVAALYALMQYYVATKLSLAMTGAHEIEKKENPRLYRIVENLAISTGAPTPKICIIEDASPNAMATGRDPHHAIVAATTGLIDIMDDRELNAVMAHEMGHIQNYDIRLSMITFGLVSAIGFLTQIVMRMFFYSDDRDNDNSPIVMIIGIVVLILSPIVAAMVQMAVSRQREYLADGTSALTTRDPEALASALRKLKTANKPMKKQNSATAHLFFSNPLKPGVMSKLFSTHPALDDRIARLKTNANKF